LAIIKSNIIALPFDLPSTELEVTHQCSQFHLHEYHHNERRIHSLLEILLHILCI
jgi:hypothetical protein